MNKAFRGAARTAVLVVLAAVCIAGLLGVALAAASGRVAADAVPEQGPEGPAGSSADLATNAPKISNVSATNVTDKRATITWQTDEMASSQVEYGLTAGYGQTASSFRYSTNHSVGLRGLSAGTTYHYRVVSTGLWFSGTSRSGDFTFTTEGEGGGDDGAPVISAVKATAITDSGATITWTTSEDADSQVEYGLTSRYGSSTLPGGALTKSHAVSLTGLAGGKTYHYRVKSKDARGNLAQSADQTFTTLENAPLAISGMVVTDVTTTGCTVIWTTSDVADRQVAYGPDTSYAFRTGRTGPETTEHRVALTGLSPSTVYHCQAISTDARGSVARSPDYQFVTGDDTPPVISQVAAGSITDTSAVITWTTDSASEGSVEYGTSTNYGLVSTYDNTMVTGHSVTLSDLAAQTTYHYKVKSRDASGLWVESPDATFTTGVDWSSDAPGIMFLTAGKVTSSEATISWSTDEMATAVVEYGETEEYGLRVALDSAMATEHSAVLKDLKSGVTYHYRVRSEDAAGNETVSADRTFNTPMGSAPIPSLPAWAWAAIGITGVLAVGALALKNR